MAHQPKLAKILLPQKPLLGAFHRK